MWTALTPMPSSPSLPYPCPIPYQSLSRAHVLLFCLCTSALDKGLLCALGFGTIHWSLVGSPGVNNWRKWFLLIPQPILSLYVVQHKAWGSVRWSLPIHDRLLKQPVLCRTSADNCSCCKCDYTGCVVSRGWDTVTALLPVFQLLHSSYPLFYSVPRVV